MASGNSRGANFFVTLSQYPHRVQSVKQRIRLHDLVVISPPIRVFPQPLTLARADDDRKYILGIYYRGAFFEHRFCPINTRDFRVFHRPSEGVVILGCGSSNPGSRELSSWVAGVYIPLSESCHPGFKRVIHRVQIDPLIPRVIKITIRKLEIATMSNC